jgi:hypothetical protein
MKPYRTLVAATLVAAAFAVGANAPATAAEPHSHAAAHGPAKLALDHGKKWTTDAALRQYMGEIRTLVATDLGAIHAGKASPAQYQALGAAVEKKVGSIVAECKLPPAADAMLHLIVADLVAGADVMQGKTPGKPEAGAHKVVTAANAYGRYFDHPGWKQLG